MSGEKERAKFRWLEIYLDNEEEIANLELDIRHNEIELERWTEGDLAHVPLTKGSKGGRLEEIIAEKRKLLNEDEAIKQSTLDLVDKFDGIENQILRRKYIDGLSLSEIADCDDIHYSYSTIKRIHAELRRRLHFLEKWDLPEPRTEHQAKRSGGIKKVRPQ